MQPNEDLQIETAVKYGVKEVTTLKMGDFVEEIYGEEAQSWYEKGGCELPSPIQRS